MGAGGLTLGEYLEAAGHRRRSEGVHDCCTFPSDWAVLLGNPDPMAKWRGTYSTDQEAEELIAAAADAGEGLGRGGLEMLFAEGMWEAGIPEIDYGPEHTIRTDPQAGDIGVLNLAGNEAGGIYTGKRWAFVPDRGIGFVSLDLDCIARAWRPLRRG
jgi:hypothetical protein